MIWRFWPLFVIAFIVGSLFRLYIITGIGFYRMFATLGLVVLFAVASRIIVTAQLGEGGRELKAIIASLPDECDVWRLGRDGADRIIIGPAGAVVLAASSVAHYARGWGLNRGLQRLKGRVEMMVETARQRLGDALAGGPALHRAVVFLRRAPRPEDRRRLQAWGIDVLQLDEVYDYIVARAVEGTGGEEAGGGEGGGEAAGAGGAGAEGAGAGSGERRAVVEGDPPEGGPGDGDGASEVVRDPALCYTGGGPSGKKDEEDPSVQPPAAPTRGMGG